MSYIQGSELMCLCSPHITGGIIDCTKTIILHLTLVNMGLVFVITPQKYGKPCFRAEFRGPPSHPPWHSHPFVAAYSIAQAGTKHLLVALSPDPALTIVVGGSSICAADRKIAV